MIRARALLPDVAGNAEAAPSLFGGFPTPCPFSPQVLAKVQMKARFDVFGLGAVLRCGESEFGQWDEKRKALARLANDHASFGEIGTTGKRK